MSIHRKFISGLAGLAQIATLLLSLPPAWAQPPRAHSAHSLRLTADQPFQDPNRYQFGANDALPAAQATENAAITHGRITVNGQSISYTASAGHLTATDPVSGQAKATMFYVAYTADGKSAAKRPLTFFYNGGPGSASVWLHLGSFAPKRIVTGDPNTDQPKPFPFVDNAQSLIDTTDMVFVDAIGTGQSEALTPYTNRAFWGVDSDAAVFRDFITRYIQVNRRSSSPKYLFGESYGTPRSDVLANLLEIGGTRLSGIVLHSSVLNYNSNADMATGSNSGYMPGYAAVGAHFSLLTPVPAHLEPFLRQMRTFVAGRYQPALSSFLAQPQTPPPADLLTQLFINTGYPAALWRNNFNLDETTFRSTLIPGYLLGRYDGRVIAANNSPLAADGDPSDTLITQPFTDRINDYLPKHLKYSAASAYNVMNDDTINDWDWTHDGLAMPDTIPDLAAAMYLNPKLKVLSMNGYHDLATPFYITEQDLGRLGTVSGLQITHYPGGHMIYLNDPSRPKMKQDLVNFYKRQR
jgi:carboxypeptidase C (cathepsin A)